MADKTQESTIVILENFSDSERQLYQSLRNEASFSSLPEDLFVMLVQAMNTSELEEGQEILKQGTECQQIHIILEGKVGIYVDSKLLYELNRRGDVFGEISFVTGDLASASISATSPLRLACIDHKSLENIGASRLYLWISHVLIDKLSRTSKAVNELEAFFKNIQNVDSEDVQAMVGQWEKNPLFNQIGQIVRDFYDQMTSIRSEMPDRLGGMGNYDMADASERLQHIVTMTENAANKTMDLAEELLNLLSDRLPAYDEFLSSVEPVLKLDNLPEEAKEVLLKAQSIIQEESTLNNRYQGMLTDILVAQDYQDLTGQVINKIVNLLNSLEQELVMLVSAYGKSDSTQQKPEEELKGPLSEESEERCSQEDTDELLKSLGF